MILLNWLNAFRHRIRQRRQKQQLPSPGTSTRSKRLSRLTPQQIELLEERILLVGPTTLAISGSDLLFTDGTPNAANDILIVSDTTINQYVITDNNNTINTSIAGASGSGTNTVTVPFSSVVATTNIIFDTLDGDDTLTIDLSSGNFNKAITFNGGTQTSGDNLKITGGTFTAVTVDYLNANDGSIALSGLPVITYTGLEGGQRSLDLQGLSVSDLTLNFSAANDTINLSDAEGPTDISSPFSLGTRISNPSGTLVVNGGDGNDTITITELALGFSGDLILDGGNGIDSISIDGDVSLASNKSFIVSAEVISVNATLSLAGTGNVTLVSTGDITTQTNASITTENGDITLQSGGNVTINANLATTGTAEANLLVQADGDIVFNSGADVSANGVFNVVLNSNFDESGSGAIILNSGTVIDSNNGNLTVGGGANPLTTAAVGASGITEGYGVNLLDAQLLSGNGNLSVRGQGGSSSTGESNMGVHLISNSLIQTANGNLSIAGTGGTGSGLNNHVGVSVQQGSNVIVTGSGTITITGVAGEGVSRGIAVEDAGSTIQALGTGALNLFATGGAPGSLREMGGFAMKAGGAVLAPGGADINVVVDSVGADLFVLDTDAGTLSGTGNLTIRPAIASTSIGIGGGTGTLNIDDTELSKLADGFSSITIGDAAAGTVSISSSAFQDDVTIVGGDINVTGAVSNNVNEGISLNATDGVTLNANVTVTGSGAIDIDAGRQISVNGGGAVASASGAITLDANVSGLATGYFTGVFVANTASVSSTTGDITVTGRGGDAAANGNHGVQVEDTAAITSLGGNITLTGQAGGTGATNFHEGVIIGGDVTTTGSGNITLNGTGGSTSTGGVNIGVDLISATVSAVNGTVTINGVSGVGSSSDAIRLVNFGGGSAVVTTTGSGAIVLTANESAGSGVGLNAGGAASGIGGAGTAGDISITTDTISLAVPVQSSGSLTISPRTASTTVGIGGGAGTLNLDDTELGLLADGFSAITIGDSVTGTVTIDSSAFVDDVTIVGGDVNVTGAVTNQIDESVSLQSGNTATISSSIASTGTASVNVAATRNIVLQAGSSVTTVDGDITVDANVGGTSTGNFVGVLVSNATIQSTGTGNIAILGTGGDASGGFQHGVQVRNGGDIIGSTTGLLTVTGTGGGTGAGSQSHGVFVEDAGSTITSTGADVSVTGTGGAADGPANTGVYVYTSGQIASGGAGTVTVTGTGGSGAGDINTGVYVSITGQITSGGSGAVTVVGTAGSGSGRNDGVGASTSNAMITSGGGDVSVTGTAGTGTNSVGVGLEFTGQINSGGAGDVSIATDNLNVPSGSIAGTGMLTITPLTPSTTIGLGAGAGTLNLDGTELANITSGFSSITIGDATNGTGAVDIDSSTFTDNVTIVGGSIAVTELFAGTNAVTLTARSGAITDGGDVGADVTAFSLTASATAGIGTGANSIETVVSNLEASGGTGGVNVSNTGNLTVGGVGATVGVSATGGDITITASGPLTANEAVINSGGGSINLTSAGGPPVLTLAEGPGSPYTGFSLPENLVSADFDGVNGLDIAVVDPNGGGVRIMLNDGSGGFTVGNQISFGLQNTALAVGDFDGINGPDLAVTAQFANGVFILLNDGFGGFSVSGGSPYTTSNPGTIAVADFDGINGPDFAVNSFGDVKLFKNDGAGGFLLPTTILTGVNTTKIVAGDFDGINGPDLFAGTNGATSNVLLNDGSGGFTTGTVVAGVGVSSLAVADFDGINGLDVVLADFNSSAFVLLNNGSGAFSPSVGGPYSLGGGIHTIATGDFDGVNGPDFVSSDPGGNSLPLYLNDGSGGFTLAPGSPFAAGVGPRGITIGDFDADGNNDLAVADGGEGKVRVLLNQGLTTNDVLTINADVTVSGGNGNIVVNASRNIVLNPGASVATTNGDITIEANPGGASAGNFVGVNIAAANVTSASGAITLTGTGGDTGGHNHGVRIQTGGTVSSTGSGSVTINGTALGTGDGVYILQSGTQVTSVTGNLLITGVAVADSGVTVSESAIVSSTGAGTVSINGTGAENGVIIVGSGLVTSQTGDVDIIGSSSGGDGVEFSFDGKLTSTGTANLSIDGISTAGVPGGHGVRVAITGTQIDSAGNNLLITGSSNGDSGINIFSDAAVTAGSGNIQIVTDSLNLGSGITFSGTGNLDITPNNAATSIGLGGGAGTLNLDDAEIARFANGFSSITIGGKYLETEDFSSGTLPASLEAVVTTPTFSNGTVIFPGSTDNDRNALRTVIDDYNTTDFVAEITVTVTSTGTAGLAFLGLGTGDRNGNSEPIASPSVAIRVGPSD
jgi:hypothetical protein